MTYKELYTTAISKDAGKLYKKSARLFCQVIGNDIYITDSYIAFKVNPLEYDIIFRPVTKCDPGTWTIQDGERLKNSLNLASIFTEAEKNAEKLTPAKMLLPLEKDNLRPLYNEKIAFPVNDSFLSAFNGDKIELLGQSETRPVLVRNTATDTACGIILPVRFKDYNKLKNAIKALNGEETKRDDAAELENLKRELEKAKEELARLKLAQKEEEKKYTPQEKAALLSPFGKVTIKGEQTKSPIIWIESKKENAEELKKHGCKWSARRAAWYLPA